MSRYHEELDEALRQRPASGPEPTLEESYFDSGSAPGGFKAPEPDPPWTDTSDDREEEL